MRTRAWSEDTNALERKTLHRIAAVPCRAMLNRGIAFSWTLDAHDVARASEAASNEEIARRSAPGNVWSQPNAPAFRCILRASRPYAVRASGRRNHAR